MSWFGKGGKGNADAEAAAMAKYRQDAWAYALENDQLPEFVEDRLKSAAARKVPWLSTMTPAELLLGNSHGLRPLATVSGTCWYHYGYSWTNGHAEGWDYAIARLKREALAVGANAVVDVQMRKVQSPMSGSMDFTLFGTAVKFDALPASSDPVIATVSALDFVRLLEMGIAVCGIAVGASYDYLEQQYGSYGSASFGENRYGASSSFGVNFGGPAWNAQQALRVFGGNAPVMELTNFWESVRRDAHAQLRRSARRIGNGVLARTQFGQLIRVERDQMPPNYLGRHIVIGTVVETKRGDGTVHHIETVVDMRDELSPLIGGTTSGNDFAAMNEQAGGI
jgi:hypothetical protein